jgi:hypothetical protein
MTELYLSPSHRQMLEQGSGIAPVVIAARGYRTVTGEEALTFGFRGQQARPGLLIPVHTTDGKLALAVLRPDQPRIVEDKRHKKEPTSGDRPQKIIKYEWPQGVEPRVDCPPLCFPDLKDPAIPLWITEGQKKGDALASWGLCVIDLPGGVWGWKSKRAGVLADLDYVVWTGRDVFVVFDSDVMTKSAVAQALGRLVKLLSRRGANITPVPLPQQGDEKLGVDDFKARGGTLEQLHAFAGLGQLLPLRTDSRISETESAEYLKALAELGYDFTMNAIDDSLEVNGQPMTDPQRAEIRTRMRDAGYRHVNVIEDAYTAHAWRRQHHPVKEFLHSLEWDGAAHIARLAGYIETDHADLYRSVTGDEDLLGNLVFYLWLRRWLIGAVGKALDARQNLMLVLDGPQGIGKSHLVQWLGSILPAYFIEAPINPDDKDAWLRLMAKFIWEVGELGATARRADREALKNFITTRMVTVRKPYGHFDTIKPALASLIGTINNESGFLTDPTGNRRFLICRLTGLDWGYVEKIELRQLWAEAVALYEQGEPWQPIPAEAQLQAAINEEYMVEVPLEMMLFKYFEVNPAVDIWTPAIDVVTTLEGLGLKGLQAQHLRELSNLMKSLGVQKGRPRLPGRPVAYRGLYRSNKK